MKRFLPDDPDKPYLLPPSPRERLPNDHPALFVRDVVQHLDLSLIYADYRDDVGGQPGLDPHMSASGSTRTPSGFVSFDRRELTMIVVAPDPASMTTGSMLPVISMVTEYGRKAIFGGRMNCASLSARLGVL